MSNFDGTRRKSYRETYRRVLLDMHIPDHDSAFLVRVDPARIVDTYRRAGFEGAMFYAQSHVGLCYWQTRSGRTHPGIGDRDLVSEWSSALAANGMAGCAYYSVTFNNWAAAEHPEWRTQGTTRTDGSFPGPRYGTVCPNNPAYRAFLEDQISELVSDHPLDAIFFDMTYVFPTCVCSHCQRRSERETGNAIPETVDWLSTTWASFEERRQAWATEYGVFLTETARRHRPDISVHHNFISPRDWVLASPFGGTDANDYLAGDFYGDPDEQLVVMKLYDGLSRGRPVEFMTSLCRDVTDHVTLKPREEIERSALATIGSSAAYLLIDGVDPSGEINEAAYEPLRDLNARIASLEPYLGGTSMYEVGIYFSGASRMDLLESGRRFTDVPGGGSEYPHFHAVRGAARALQTAHVPFGIITRRQLDELDRLKLLILPNAVRMDAEEVNAVRGYVQRGGTVYASRYTSLLDTEGRFLDDFALADVFGCHFGSDDLSGSLDRRDVYPARPTLNFAGTDFMYLEPATGLLAEAIAPQRFLAHRPSPTELAGGVRLHGECAGEVLASLTLPYADRWGSATDVSWSSIHSSPPWRRDVAPAIVHHRLGLGQAVYSAMDIEVIDTDVNRALFLRLVDLLVPGGWGTRIDAPGSVWLDVRHQPQDGRILVSLVDRSRAVGGPVASDVSLELRPPPGQRFGRVVSLPEMEELPSTTSADGWLRTQVPRVDGIALVAAYVEYR